MRWRDRLATSADSAYAGDVADRFFPYERDGRWKILLAPLGIKDDDGVTVTDDLVRATFGYWSVETPTRQRRRHQDHRTPPVVSPRSGCGSASATTG